MRTSSHIIDTKSIKRVLSLIPNYWVVRELTERDYGIDLLIEIFEETGKDKNGYDTFDSTGAVFHAQVKGTMKPIKPKRNKKIGFSFDKSAILYTERFNTPFLLFRIDVSTDNAECYFMWIQRYVEDVLDFEIPDWRNDKKKSLTVEIPEHNKISSELKKIEYIASRPRLIQEMVNFREIYLHLSQQLNAAAQGNLKINVDSLKILKILASRIYNLKLIFKYNNCCIDRSSAKELLEFVNSLDVNTELSDFSNHPHQFNFDSLSKSLNGFDTIENMTYENDHGTAY